MASLKDIRRRVSSVKNTQQITKAMKMVAASKLRRAQQAIAGARPYAEKLEEVTGNIVAEILAGAASLDDHKKAELLSNLHPLLRAPQKEVLSGERPARVAFLVITSDRGLCGAYNTNAIRSAYRRYKELAEKEKAEVFLFFAGKRGFEFFQKRGLVGHFFSEIWTGRFSTKKSDEIANIFVEKFLSGEFDRVEVSFTEFRSALAQVPTCKQILPMTVAATGTAEVSAPFIYEPERREILGTVLPNQVKTALYRTLADSVASEFGARMTAMDNATRNASDMIAKLTLLANRVRQAGITTELMEIIGGAEAMKG